MKSLVLRIGKMVVVRSVLGITFSFLQLELESAAEALSTAERVMLSRDLVPRFVLQTVPGCGET